jgi:nicotinamidase-related amidase
MPKENLPCLILIDIQMGLDEWNYYGTERNNPDAEKNAGRLLALWRKLNGLVIHVKHNSTDPKSPLYPSRPGNMIKKVVTPIESEIVLSKQVNSAFIGTPLQQILMAKDIKQIIIAGLTAEHCISTSIRMAANLGFNIGLVADATAAFDKIDHEGRKIPAEDVYKVTIANLSGEFCHLTSTDDIVKSKTKYS